MKTADSHRDGFTLIEIALVLVVIGLMIGGIVGGSKLVQQSQLQTVINDYGKYSAAVRNFKTQYGGFPGDLIDATDYWNSGGGTGAATDNTCQSGITASKTCNGDGDGNIASSSYEPYLAWQQLVLGKFLEGSYTGAPSGNGAVPGTNVPKSRISGAGFSLWYKAATGALATPPAAADANQYDQDLSNYLAFGATVAAGLTQGPAITPSDASQIDTKSDDGAPGTGRVVAMKPAFAQTPNCVVSPGADNAATYQVTFQANACGLNMSLTLK